MRNILFAAIFAASIPCALHAEDLGDGLRSNPPPDGVGYVPTTKENLAKLQAWVRDAIVFGTHSAFAVSRDGRAIGYVVEASSEEQARLVALSRCGAGCRVIIEKVRG